MARHRFTVTEQLRATERALTSPNTPKQLVDSLRLRASKLRKQIAQRTPTRRGLLEVIGIGGRRK
jgi:hypothetical protein